MAVNLPPQMQALLDAMPPGANLFDYIQATLDEEVFPSLSKAFWTQLWIAVVLLVIIVLGFAAGFVIRILRRRTKFMISDGQLTRPDPKVCVPILWSIVAICDIVLNLIFRKAMRQKSSSVVLGRFWLLLHLPLIVSYILVGSNVLASTPNFRRHFINMNRGALWFNLGTAGIILAMSAGVVPPAIALGDALHSASVGYNNALVIIQEARATGDITRLLSLQESLGHLEQASKDNVSATRAGNIVYAAYIAIYLVACIIPAILLSRYINNKISRLEQDKNPDTSQNFSSMGAYKNMNLPLRDFQKDLPSSFTSSAQHLPRTGLNFIPEQPKDRPFAQLVAVETPLLPSRFNNILQDHTASNAGRALRLRKALRTDIRFLAAYVLQLCAFGGMTIFLTGKNVASLTTRQDMTLSLAFPTWNFIVPGLIVSAAFLYDALAHQEAEELVDHALPLNESLRQSTTKLSTIQCSQVVDIAYTSDRDEKRIEDLEDEELRSIRESWHGKA